MFSSRSDSANPNTPNSSLPPCAPAPRGVLTPKSAGYRGEPFPPSSQPGAHRCWRGGRQLASLGSAGCAAWGCRRARKSSSWPFRGSCRPGRGWNRSCRSPCRTAPSRSQKGSRSCCKPPPLPGKRWPGWGCWWRRRTEVTREGEKIRGCKRRFRLRAESRWSGWRRGCLAGKRRCSAGRAGWGAWR